MKHTYARRLFSVTLSQVLGDCEECKQASELPSFIYTFQYRTLSLLFLCIHIYAFVKKCWTVSWRACSYCLSSLFYFYYY